jgi:predicted metal-binding protein
MKVQYKTKRLTARIGLQDFLQGSFIDPERFLACCRECPSYGQLWSCPPYDFSIEDFWRGFSMLTVIGIQIIPDLEIRSVIYIQEEAGTVLSLMRREEKKLLSEELFKMEESRPGSVLLTVGSCDLCGVCTRPSGAPCVLPGRMRFSIESLGGNVEKIARELLGTELLWIKDGILPAYTMLIGGLLER